MKRLLSAMPSSPSGECAGPDTHPAVQLSLFLSSVLLELTAAHDDVIAEESRAEERSVGPGSNVSACVEAREGHKNYEKNYEESNKEGENKRTRTKMKGDEEDKEKTGMFFLLSFPSSSSHICQSNSF
ncbi:uncharacterized [Tachysurus ichikawai]